MRNKKSKIPEIKSYLTYDELEQLAFGSWLKKNAGIIGSVLGGAVGTIIAPGIGTQIGASIGGAVGGTVSNNEANKEAVDAQNLMIKQQNAQAQAQAELQRLQNSSPMKTFTPIMKNGGEVNEDTNSKNENNTSKSSINIPNLNFKELISYLQNNADKKGYTDIEEKTAKNITLHYVRDNATGKVLAINLIKGGGEEEAKETAAQIFSSKGIKKDPKYIDYLGSKTYDNLNYIKLKIPGAKKPVVIPDFSQLYDTPETRLLNHLAFNNKFVENYRQNFPQAAKLIDNLVNELNKLPYSYNDKLKIITDFIDNTILNASKNFDSETSEEITKFLNNSYLSKDKVINLAKELGLSEQEISNYLRNISVRGTKENDLKNENDIYTPGIRTYAQSLLMREPSMHNFFVILDSIDRYDVNGNWNSIDLPVSGIRLYSTNTPDSNGNFSYNANIYTSLYNPRHIGSNLISRNNINEFEIGKFNLINSNNVLPETKPISGDENSSISGLTNDKLNKILKFITKKFYDTIENIPDKKEFGGVINYEGQTHNGPDGGIPIDEMGNPVAASNNKSVALVEKGEIAFTHPNIGTYIFSNKLKYNSNETFADKAKNIQKKYKLRMKDGKVIDSISEVAYNKEMLNLMKEQELYRELSGINKEEKIKEQFKNMGIPIENNVLPIGENGIYIKPTKKKPFSVYSKNIEKNNLTLNNNFPSFDIGGLANSTIGLGEALLPSITSTIANSFLLGKMKKRNLEKIIPPIIQAPKVNYNDFRNTMIENSLANEAQLRRNALLTGASGAQALQTINTTGNEVNRQLNENLFKSYIAEQELNAKNKLQADITNAQSRLEADRLNLQKQLEKDKTIDLIRSSIANAWAQGFSEYLKGRKEFSALNMQAENYKLEPDKDQNIFGKLFFPKLNKTVI